MGMSIHMVQREQLRIIRDLYSLKSVPPFLENGCNTIFHTTSSTTTKCYKFLESTYCM
jgi:hypothetical protein